MGFKEIRDMIGGNDPDREAKGNMAVINSTILLIVCLIKKGALSQYQNIIISKIAIIDNIMQLLAVFITFYVAAYSLFGFIQLIRTNDDEKVTQNYIRPSIEKLNLFSWIFLVYLSGLVITGTKMSMLLITKSKLDILFLVISLFLVLINIFMKIHQFVWRKIN